jgi:hypothetical protein
MFLQCVMRDQMCRGVAVSPSMRIRPGGAHRHPTDGGTIGCDSGVHEFAGSAVQFMAHIVALAANWWNLFVRLTDPRPGRVRPTR